MRAEACRGIEVSICVDGNALAEHDRPQIDRPDHGSPIKYIESKPGQNFEILVKVDSLFRHRETDLACKVQVDGHKTNSRVLSLNNSHYESRKTIIQGTQWTEAEGRGVLRRFCFAELKTTDEHSEGQHVGKVKNMGQIRVDIVPVIAGASSVRYRDEYHNSLDKDTYIHEKFLKGQAISNRVSLGAKESTGEVKKFDCSYPYGRKPIATFKFYYRSYRDLQIEGIIPRTPSPVPLEDHDPTTLTEAEARELIVILQRQRRGPSTKREQSRTPARHYIKRERIEVLIENDDGLIFMEEETRAAKRARMSNRLRDPGVEIVNLADD